MHGLQAGPPLRLASVSSPRTGATSPGSAQRQTRMDTSIGAARARVSHSQGQRRTSVRRRRGWQTSSDCRFGARVWRAILRWRSSQSRWLERLHGENVKIYNGKRGAKNRTDDLMLHHAPPPSLRARLGWVAAGISHGAMSSIWPMLSKDLAESIRPSSRCSVFP